MIEKLRDATRDGELAADVARHLQIRIAHQREALRTEHRALRGMIAHLSAEASSLAQSLGTVTGMVRRLLEERIEEAGTELARHEARLTEVEQVLVLLDQTEADARWVSAALVDFDAVWEAMTIENRGRLMRALVQQVEVNGPAGTVTAVLSDLGPGGEREGAAASPAPNNHASL